jgi:hypothetical protein
MTKHAPKPKPDNPAQSQRFIDAAKEAGVDETGEGFDKAFKKIVPEKRAAKTTLEQ